MIELHAFDTLEGREPMQDIPMTVVLPELSLRERYETGMGYLTCLRQEMENGELSKEEFEGRRRSIADFMCGMSRTIRAEAGIILFEQG